MHTGIAKLPLHSGDAPPWLFNLMKKLSRELLIVLVSEYGQKELLRRLSDPFWFQALGCALGFDWHSSGLTTTVTAALKEGVSGLEKDLGIFIAGGKGARSRQTPDEIILKAEKASIEEAISKKLIYASRLSAKIDNTAVQDGYQIYHHSFFFTREGDWAVIQQGMNINLKYARRYHWLSEKLNNWVCEPQAAICCDHISSQTLNMVSEENEATRQGSINLLLCERPANLLKELKHHYKELKLPARHDIEPCEFDIYKLCKTLYLAYERQPADYEQLLGIRGVGPKTIRALALLSELIYGTEISWRDPARFAFAHGGKDGTPFPVDRKTYQQSIEVLKEAINKAKIDDKSKLMAIKRLRLFY